MLATPKIFHICDVEQFSKSLSPWGPHCQINPAAIEEKKRENTLIPTYYM